MARETPAIKSVARKQKWSLETEGLSVPVQVVMMKSTFGMVQCRLHGGEAARLVFDLAEIEGESQLKVGSPLDLCPELNV